MAQLFQDASVLITGGLGFVGGNLSLELFDMGSKITIYDSMLKGSGASLENIKKIKDRVTLKIADVRDFETLRSVVREKDAIFHLAATVNRIDSVNDPKIDFDINCFGTLNLLEAARQCNDGAIIVYSGSRAQYGRVKKLPVNEDCPDNPIDPYGTSKLAGEKYVLMYSNVYGLRTTSIRINNTYGPGMPNPTGRYGVLNWFIKLALEGETMTVFEPGTQMRDYNDIRDVVGALVSAALNINESEGEYFLLGSGRAMRFIDIVKKILETVGNGRMKLVPWPKDWSTIDVGDFEADFRKIRSKLGWHPRIQLEAGILETMKYYKSL